MSSAGRRGRRIIAIASYPMYCCRGSMVGRIKDRRVVPSGGLPRMPVPAAVARGPPAMLTGGGIAARSPVSLTLPTGNALAAAPLRRPACPRSAAPTARRRWPPGPVAADTAPPTGAVPTDPRVLATLLSPALTSVNAAAVESAAVAAEFDPFEKADSRRQNDGRDRCESADPRVDGVRLQRFIYIAEDLLDDRFDRRPGCVPTELATAALWAAKPAGLVFCCGAVNGVSVAAAAEEPA